MAWGDDMAKTSAAVKNKYNAKAYDRVNLTMPKGKKEQVQDFAATTGESVNGFINRAIDETIERALGDIPAQQEVNA